MSTQQQTAELSGETIRNVAGTLIRLAQPPEQLEEPSRSWVAYLRENQAPDKLRARIKILTDSFRARHDAMANICTAFQERFQKAAENFSPGREMDPDDIAVPQLEKSEEQFRRAREELRDVRDILQRTGGAEIHGSEVFAALERLDKLFEHLIASFQEIRWAIMIHDGALAPSPSGTCTSGSEFMASIENS